MFENSLDLGIREKRRMFCRHPDFLREVFAILNGQFFLLVERQAIDGPCNLFIGEFDGVTHGIILYSQFILHSTSIAANIGWIDDQEEDSWVGANQLMREIQ
jgi:hypothetical protein